MKVSVIIPTHNRLVSLQRAYESVLSQTRIPEEIIIIDDGSKIPVTPEVINTNILGITTIIERFESSVGSCNARNKGIEIASGEILMFLDDDDTWEKTKIEDQLAIFAKKPEIGLVYSGRLVVKEGNRDQVIYKIKPKASGNLYPKILYSNLIGTTSSVAIKKDILEAINGFDSRMPSLEDYELWIRATQKTLVEYDSSYNVRYTIYDNPKSQLSGQVHRHIKAIEKILTKYHKQILAQGIIGSRKIRAATYFAVAKALRNQGLIPATPWIIKSFIQYPSPKTLLLFLPIELIQTLQNLTFKIL